MADLPTAEKRRQKLDLLVEFEGFDSVDTLCAATIADSVSPAICMNDGCDYTAEMEPDQDRGWCEVCGTDFIFLNALPTGTSLV